jgi:putative LysE/RhtB family amino acid efflux pump
MSAFVLGVGLGVAVAAQVGPVSLLVIRTVLRGAFVTGLAMGAGVAIIDASYAGLGALGAGALLEVDALRLAMGVLGAAVLAVFAARTLWSAFRVRLGGEAGAEVATPRAALVTALAATASNPLTILSWAAIFAAASTADVASGPAATVALLGGVAVGSFAWMAALTAACSLARRRVGERTLRTVDVVAGTGLLGFAGLLGWRSLRES